MANPKEVYHGTTVTGQNAGNPPPYSPPQSQPQYPQPGYPAPQYPQPGNPSQGATVYPGPTTAVYHGGGVYPGSTTVYSGGTIVTSQPQHTTVIGMPTAAVIISREFGSQPQPYTCKSCGQRIVTRVDYRPTMRTHLCALLLCMLALWPCCFIPYCVRDCLSADHYCPHCSVYLGSEWSP